MDDFAEYERLLRPFVEANQNLVDVGDAELFPGTAEALAARNAALRARETVPAGARPEHSAMTLPDFGQRHNRFSTGDSQEAAAL